MCTCFLSLLPTRSRVLVFSCNSHAELDFDKHAVIG
jgi:hypothetical protein